jgi:hypothetical protein
VLRLVPVNILNELRSTYFFGKGKAKLRRGDKSTALGCFEKMFEHAERSGDEASIALAFRAVAEVFMAEGMIREARLFAEKGRAILARLEKESGKYTEPRKELEGMLREIEKRSGKN